MTTSLPHTHVRLRDLSELVAGIPYILGFPPTDSLVLFTFRRYPVFGLSTTIRVDLPKPEHVPPVVAEVVAAVSRNKAVAAIAVVVGDPEPEHRQLVDSLRMSLADNGILLTHASWVRKVVHGEQWQCYDDPLCTGEVPDPETSALAAAVAVAGDTTYPSREAVAAHLTPDPGEALARRKALLKAYRTQPGPYGEPDVHEDLATLGHALDRAMTSYDLPTLNDHQLVRLAQALSRPEIKDACLAMVLADEPEPAERLWTVLVRSLPAPERAEPAFLLAISAYLRGAGVLAALTLQIAMESNPRHALAIALDHALQSGLPPDTLRDMLMESVMKNNKERPSSTSPPDDDPPWDTTPERPDETPEHPASEPPTPSVSTAPEPQKTTEPGDPVASNAGAGPAIDVASTQTESSVAPDPTTATDLPAHGESVHTPLRFVRLPAGFPISVVPPSAQQPAAGTENSHEPADRDLAGTLITAPTVQADRDVMAAPAWPSGPASTVQSVDQQAPAATGSTSPMSADEAARYNDPQTSPGSPRTAPGALSQRAAASLGPPSRHTTVMDALSAFLPPVTERSEPE